jgi:hypothetical protein
MNFESDDAKQFVLSSSGLVTYIDEKNDIKWICFNGLMKKFMQEIVCLWVWWLLSVVR